MKNSAQITAIGIMLVMSLIPTSVAAGREVAPGEWEDVPRIISIGDVHGAFDKLASILIQSELTDADLNWTGGQDHLVLAGDYTDRGARERDVMDLLMRLQDQSVAAGGRVHPLIGNHELMNLIRDLRYVEPEGFAEFAEDENPRERKDLRKAWVQANVSPGGDRKIARANFDTKFPPGFLARSRNFERGRYGTWVLEQSVTVMINGVVFVHGGISPEFAEMRVAGINRTARQGIQDYLRHRSVLEARGVISPMSYYHANRITAKSIVEGGAVAEDPDLLAAAEGMHAYTTASFFGDSGPMWHRAFSKANERFERDNLAKSLELLGARVMVVGHTRTGNRKITKRFSGQLYRSDVSLAYGGDAQALIFENGDVRVLDAESRSTGEPHVEEPPGLAVPKDGPSESELLPILETAPTLRDRVSGGAEERGARWLHLRKDKVSAFASFWGTDVVANHRRAAQELSAFALDRLLGFELVPLTLVRELDGVTGTLQHVDPRAIDGISVDEHDLPLWDAEDLATQRLRTQVFDALTGNCRRESTEILFLRDAQQVQLVNHSRAFARSLLAGCGEGAPLPELDPGLTGLLDSLSPQRLSDALGPWLNPEQIAAILTRRDRLTGVLQSESE